MIANVRASLDAILGALVPLTYANGAGRIFELFVMTGIASRLQQQGLEVWLQRSDGTRILPADPIRRFVQRGGVPGGVRSAAEGPNNASVIGFRKQGSPCQWEIWNGIAFEGRSGAAHEIDVAVVPREVGEVLRVDGGLPFGRPRVSIECKDVGQPGMPDEMRAFVARLYDLTILRAHQSYLPFTPPNQAIYPGILTNTFYGSQFTYWDENRNAFNAIARRTGFTSGAADMTVYYSVEPHGNIVVGSAEADGLMAAVSDWIIARFP